MLKKTGIMHWALFCFLEHEVSRENSETRCIFMPSKNKRHTS